jgi:protoheme IX farnesyltransferase
LRKEIQSASGLWGELLLFIVIPCDALSCKLDDAPAISYILNILPWSRFMRLNPGAASMSAPQLILTKTSDFIELTKPRLTSLVLFTTLVGFCSGISGPIPVLLLLHTLVGTALMAGGASAFNMYVERELDALMKRTALRPLAAGRLKSAHALLFALAISTGGFIYLFFFVNHLTSLLSAIIFSGYLFLYTPLKTRTWWCTFAGAVPGALPIMMGWTGAMGSLSWEAWLLFTIVFLWQLPHFYSIGWMYREDYAHARLPVLSVIDWSGRRTGRQAVVFILILICFTLLPYPIDLAGLSYLAGATMLGVIFLAFGIHFARLRDRLSARRLFVASALYLPALLILLMLDRLAL